MNTPHHPWLQGLSDAELMKLASPTVFARGQTYARSGAIQQPHIPALDADEHIALEATVLGTQPYQTRVWISKLDERLAGDCDCRHAEDGYFCKHQVALALTLRGVMGGDAPAPDEAASKKVAAAAKRAATQTKNREALRAFLGEQSAATLASKLWDWAENDRHLMADLKVWMTQAQAGNNPKSLKAALTELLKSTKGFLGWRDSNLYAQRARQVLPMLAPWLQQDPVVLRELCEHVLLRVFKVAQHSDDSGGAIGELLIDVHDLLIDALRASPPPAAWADRWRALIDADPWGLWSEIEVLDVAGPAVQKLYAERAAQEWHQWLQAHPPRQKPSTRFESTDWERRKLRTRHIDCLRQSGDVQAVIDAMKASADDAIEFSELIRYCEAHERYREAMQHALAAHQRCPNDQMIEDDLVRCYERDGWDDEALDLRRRQLERQPDATRYRAVLEAAQHAGRDLQAYRNELFAWAEQQEQAPKPRFEFSSFADRRAGSPTQPNVSVRVDWLLAEQRTEEALALVSTPGHRCHIQLLEQIADALPPGPHGAAVQLLLRVFQLAMQHATSPYREPLDLVHRIVARMEAPEAADWLAALRKEHKARRNFIAGLP